MVYRKYIFVSKTRKPLLGVSNVSGPILNCLCFYVLFIIFGFSNYMVIECRIFIFFYLCNFVVLTKDNHGDGLITVMPL